MKNWQDIAIDSCILGADAWMVVALRVAKLAQGGPNACDEARLMVMEKLESTEKLTVDLVSGRLGKTPDAIASNTVAHYRRRVRANRQRLAKSPGA